MRETDTSKIPTAVRVFIKTGDWDDGEMRQFYFTGYEKVTKTSKAGNEYTQYYVYLLPIMPAGGVDIEVTLGLFPNQLIGLKGVANYQQVNITKRVTVDDSRDYNQEDYDIVGTVEVLAEANRPEPVEYPEMKQVQSKPALPASQLKEGEEINIDDIPF